MTKIQEKIQSLIGNQFVHHIEQTRPFFEDYEVNKVYDIDLKPFYLENFFHKTAMLFISPEGQFFRIYSPISRTVSMTGWKKMKVKIDSTPDVHIFYITLLHNNVVHS